MENNAPKLRPTALSSQLFSVTGADDRLFRRTLVYVSIALAAVLIIVPLIKLADDDVQGTSHQPSRYVELLLEATPEELEKALTKETKPEDAEEEPELEEAAPEQ
ncbi:MAG: hypothetical protein OXT49_01190, partial [Gammaproteobacteria bacterium]|nr:hypothetical protein [Gammaproteobacteria bacterium]